MAYSHKLVKRSFFSGKYDREFSGQENAITAAGMVYCKNVLSSPQGECKARPGTEHLLDLDSESVIIPFRRAEKDLALVFSPSKLKIRDFDGQNTDFTNTTEQIITWTNTANNVPAETPVSITGAITGDTSTAYNCWTAANSVFHQIQIPEGNDYPITYFNMGFLENSGKALSVINIIFSSLTYPMSSSQQDVRAIINDIFLQYSDDNTTWTTVQLASGITWRLLAGYNAIKLESLLTSAHEYWRIGIIWNRNNTNMTHFNGRVNITLHPVSSEGGIFEETTTSIQEITTPYTSDLLKKLKYSQHENDLIICDGEHSPYKFHLEGNTPTFSALSYNPDFFTSDGYPACVRFFQNRLYYGGFKNKPTRVRGSRFDDYTDFAVVSQDATVADPISIECNQFDDRITDLWGGFTVLYAQSAAGIAFVTGMSSTPDFTLRCTEAASGITPTMKDNFMYYVGLDRRKIHMFSFDNNIQQFVAPDVSLYWQEVLKNQISEIHYVDSRCKGIVGSLEDGTGFFLLQEGRDVGYFPFNINGQIYDISVLKKGDSVAQIVLVVYRNFRWVVEKLHMPEFMLETNAFEQTNWERNLATQQNLIKSPYFDCWKKIINEHDFLWNYDAAAGTITPTQSDVTLGVDFANYVGKYVRFYYGSGIRDYYDLLINAVIDAENKIISVSAEGNTTESKIFNKFQLPIETIQTAEPVIQAQDNGVYCGTFTVEDGTVTFKEPMFNVQYGVPYRKIGVIEDNRSYLRQKAWGAIAFNIIDTMALKVGIKLDRLTNIVKWDGNQFFDSNLIMKNGTLICNIADIPQYEKQLIFMTDEGLPFTVLAIETAGEISDKGAN